DLQYPGVFMDDFFSPADRIANRRKPLIAAVAGYALGGGCELAMICDFIYAADNARFGQPEINLGVLPGIGGTQRLTRAIGKAKAMEMCLTGRQMDAREAEQAGLVAKIFPVDQLLEETLKTAQVIASKSLPSVMMTRECVNRVFETSVAEGVRFERRVLHSIFATADQTEGMQAFVERRRANFEHNRAGARCAPFAPRAGLPQRCVGAAPPLRTACKARPREQPFRPRAGLPQRGVGAAPPLRTACKARPGNSPVAHGRGSQSGV